MAKLCGVQIKNVKTFRGREYPTNYQGMVYLNGKRLGFWSQDGNGAIVDNFDFNSKPLDAIAEEYGKAHGKDMTYYDASFFMSDLVNFYELEKTYKGLLKQGCSAVLFVTDESDYHNHACGWTNTTKEEVLPQSKKFIADFKKNTKANVVRGMVIDNLNAFEKCEDLAFEKLEVA